MITLVFLSHYSRHLLEKNISEIISFNLNLPIIIIENSQDFSLKIELESKYKNSIKVYIPEENLGFSKGMNKAIELAETDYVFLNPSDVILSFECLSGLIECIKDFKDFTLLATTYLDETIYKNYETHHFSNIEEDKKKINVLNKFFLTEVDWIDGTFILNKKKISNQKIMDEKIFIYFETMDMCLNFKKQNKKLYVINNLKFTHLGGQSHNEIYNYEASLNRNWHYNWSKFYYFKKNFGYFFAIKKSLSILIKILFKLLKYKIQNKQKDYFLTKAEFKGLLNSIMLKKSSYRPYKKNEF
jgi:GT2 family glycosyltransferase